MKTKMKVYIPAVLAAFILAVTVSSCCLFDPRWHDRGDRHEQHDRGRGPHR